MKKYTCRQCGSTFEYCRGCLLSPIPYKDAGYCSKDCYEASKNVVAPVVELEPIVEEIATVEIEDTLVENNNESLIEDIKPIDTEAMSFVEIPTTTVAETTIKKETYNTYKKKKNKYR